jgi:hypothetical protein
MGETTAAATRAKTVNFIVGVGMSEIFGFV